MKIKEKTKKDKIVEAYPNISFLSGISIKGEKDIDIRIGGFSLDGGLVLESPYELVKEESTNLSGEVTYYNFIKNSKKMSGREKKIRESYNKRILEKKKWKENRIKEIQEELERYKQEDNKNNQKGENKENEK